MKYHGSLTVIDPSATPEAESTVTSREATQSTDISDHGATSETAAVMLHNQFTVKIVWCQCLLSIASAETRPYTHKMKKTPFQEVRTYSKAIPPNNTATAATEEKAKRNDRPPNWKAANLHIASVVEP